MEEYEVRKARWGLRLQKLGRRWRCPEAVGLTGDRRDHQTSPRVPIATAEMQAVPVGGAVILVVSWISSKGPRVRGQLREKQGSQTQAGVREREDLSGKGVTHIGQEPLRSTIDKSEGESQTQVRDQEGQELSLCRPYHIEWGGPQCPCPVWKIEKSELRRVLLRDWPILHTVKDRWTGADRCC